MTPEHARALREFLAHDHILIAGAIFAVIGSIIEAIGTALSAVATTLAAAVEWVVGTALPVIFSALKYVASWIGRGFQYFFNGLKLVLSKVVTGVKSLWDDYNKLRENLHCWVQEHLGWLLKLRKAYDDWFRHTVVPVLNLIQRLRSILTIFRIFHLKFAERLDALLGKLEAKIIRNTLVLRGKLNEIVSIINLVLDPALFIKENVFLSSAQRALRGLFAALGLGFGRKLFLSEDASQKLDRERFMAKTIVDRPTDHTPQELLDRQAEVRDEMTAVTGLDPKRYA
jgi:hypothetical protein